MPRKHGFKLFKGKGRDRGSRWTYWDYEIWIMTGFDLLMAKYGSGKHYMSLAYKN